MSRPGFASALDARWLARVGAAPRCSTGRLPINFDRLLAGTSYDMDYGQSSAAFAAGRVFEIACAGPNRSYAPLLQALRETGLDVGDGGIEVFSDDLTNTVRAFRTRQRIRRILDGDRRVVLLAQAALRFQFAGQETYIRPDAVVIVPAAEKLWIVELKGFRIRAGHYPAAKIAVALEQTAVYQMALRRLVTGVGFDAALVADQAVIVCAARRGMIPIAKIHDNADRLRTLELRLNRAEAAILAAGPNVVEMTDALDDASSPAERLEAFERLVGRYGNAYGPACLNRCGGAAWCREAAADDPSRLGATQLLAAAGSIRLAHEWAIGSRQPGPGMADVAQRLAAVRRLGDAARGDVAARQRRIGSS
jgi:hypothetical protein